MDGEAAHGRRSRSWTEKPLMDGEAAHGRRSRSWTEKPLMDGEAAHRRRSRSWTEKPLIDGETATPPGASIPARPVPARFSGLGAATEVCWCIYVRVRTRTSADACACVRLSICTCVKTHSRCIYRPARQWCDPAHVRASSRPSVRRERACGRAPPAGPRTSADPEASSTFPLPNHPPPSPPPLNRAPPPPSPSPMPPLSRPPPFPCLRSRGSGCA